MSARATRSLWLPFGGAPDAALRLLCFPHAGAGASTYRAWGTASREAVAVCPVQLPGREKRQREPAITSAGELASRFAPEVIAEVRPPYAVFGHSAGAIVAFEVCREIRRLGETPPVHLFVSGRPAPGLPMRRTRLSGLTPPELGRVLRRLGGTPDVVLNDTGLLARIHPLLAADFTLNEEYVYSPEPPLELPLTIFAANRDPRTSLEEAAAWRNETADAFELHTLDGGHFAVFDEAAAVHHAIARSVASWL